MPDLASPGLVSSDTDLRELYKLAELIGRIETSHPGWRWVARNAFPENPADPGATDRYYASVTIRFGEDSAEVFSVYGPSPCAALQRAYDGACRTLN